MPAEIVKGMLAEFKAFIQRGNVIDLAVGVIMGAAFGKIVSSLVADLLMPPIGFLIGGIKFSALKFTISGIGNEAVTINYGNFIQTVIDFVIVALCVFFLVKAINAFQRKQEAAVAEPTVQEKLLMEIRDLLKARG